MLSEIVDFPGSSTAIFTATDQLSPNYDFVFTHNIAPESIQAYQDVHVKVLDMWLHAPYWMEKGLGDTVLIKIGAILINKDYRLCYANVVANGYGA